MKLKLRIFATLLLTLVAGKVFGQTISEFSPSFGTNGQPMIVINGTGFSPGTLVVKFNNVTAAATAPSPTQINAQVPLTATTGPISVKVGTNSPFLSAADFIVISQAPYITNFPATAAVGTTITIQGVQFTGATAVKFNGTNATFTPPASDSQIQAIVPANVTTGPISITTSKGTGVSSSNFFVAPSITSFSPSSGRSGTNVIITGKNFIGTTVVRLNGVAVSAFTVDSNTQITMTVPANGTTGPLSVIVSSQTISSSNFVVLPSIFSFSPFFGKPGTNVVIQGGNLGGVTSVKFNGVTAATSGVTSSQITATVPPTATSGPISVTTTNGTVTSITNFFLPPAINGFAPTNGVPGTVVTLSGVNFTNATDVSFNGASASFTVVNNTSVTATVPANATSGTISITTPGGSMNNSAIFSLPPTVSSFTPGSGVVGISVTINGGNFTNATSVQFNGVNAAFTLGNNSQLTAVVPTNATTGPISVVAPGGTGVSAANFTVDVLSLTVKLLTSNAVSVAWPSSATGFALQANTNLTSTNTWVVVTNAPVIVNGQNTITNLTTNNATFYRLKK